MPFPANAVRVMITSPGDVSAERDAVEAEIADWNNEHAERQGIVFLPVRWERAAGRQGAAGQDIINEDLVEKSDLLIGIFWRRLGTPTREDRSGSVEEIQQFAQAGKPHVIFISRRDLPYDHDRVELQRLQEFEEEVKAFEGQFAGLLKHFRSEDQLRREVRRFLNAQASSFSLPSGPTQPLDQQLSAPSITRPRWQDTFPQDVVVRRRAEKACVVMSTGPIRGRQDRVEIDLEFHNEGHAIARDLCVAYDARGGIPPEPIRVVKDQLRPDREPPRDVFTTQMRVPPPQVGPDGSAIRGQHEYVVVRVKYRDGLGDEAAFFVVRLDVENLSWKPSVDRSQSLLSGECEGFVHWDTGQGRPADLTMEEHAVISAIARRSVTSPRNYSRTILMLRGDNESMYSLDGGSGPVSPFEKENWETQRDFLPVLAQQGFLIRSSKDSYEMSDRLFEVYGIANL